MTEKVESQQSRPLTGTDIRVLAKGYWGRYFSWRLYPRVKWLMVGGAAVFALLLVLVLVASAADITSAGYRVLLILLAAVGVGCVVGAFGVYLMDRDHYVDRCVDKWEHGDPTLPDEESVVQFANGMKKAAGGDDGLPV